MTRWLAALPRSFSLAWLGALLCGLALLPGIGPAQAQGGVQPVPALTGHVVDLTGTLDAPDLAALEQKLTAFEQEKGTQIAVLLVQQTQPEDIASYANRVANAWKIGRKGVGDGVLLIVAKQDRKLRIEVAKALEGAIPDLAAKQVIDGAIAPEFKLGNYVRGVNAGVDRLMALVRGEALPLPDPGRQGSNGLGLEGFQWTDMAIFLFFAVPVAGRVFSSLFGRKGGAVVTGFGVGGLAWLVTVSLGLALVAGVLALLVTLLFGGAAQLGRGSGRGGFNQGWGGGGLGSGSSGSSWSSSSGGGGFSSGGGGDFGGGLTLGRIARRMSTRRSTPKGG